MPFLPSKLSFSSLIPTGLSPISPVIGGAQQGASVFAAALKYILESFPDRWPLPLPYFSAGVLGALTLAINSWVSSDFKRDVLDNYESHPKETQCKGDTFDFVIVGGGTAGIIVASRLANASKHIRVLLLEQGGEPSIFNDIPGMYSWLIKQPDNTFTYKSVPQKHSCQNCNNRKAVTTRGKLLGGSSSINFMTYVRGHQEDFNRWADDAVDDAWNYTNLLPYFKKSEDYNGAFMHTPLALKYHGKGGLLHVATYSYMPGITDFLAAGVELGYPLGDYNGENQEVFSRLDVTTQDGWRVNTYKAFYKDTGKPRNLCIKKFAHVTKINFDPTQEHQTPRAVGVTYVRHNITASVKVTKEVILSAGVFHSPKLLMLSGVGPSKELKALGIPVVKSLPVGQNLQDHLLVLVGPFLKTPAFNPLTDITTKVAADFVNEGEGILAGPAGLAGTAFFQSPVAIPAYPDLQVIQYSVALHPELILTLSDMFGMKRDVLRRWLDPEIYNNVDARLLFLILGRPKSTGQLSLSSTDPDEHLILEPNYLAHADDRQALFWGVKKVVELFENTTALNTPLYSKPVPGCDRELFKSDHYYHCLVKHMSASFYDHTSTCAMGAVVDSRLRVEGVKGLRVVDASVLPRIPNGNTQAATIMIGEKGADLIIGDMDKQTSSRG